MAKTKISEFSANPANNTDIDSINIAEGCAPSGINDAIRELMAQLKDFQAGTAGDSFNGPVGTTTAAAGAFTTLAASGAVTLSGGTANGVAYLNGSKVLTSGSALTFDGTRFVIGGNTATAGIPLTLNVGTGNNTNLAFQENATDKWYLRNITGNGGFSFFDVNAGSEQMRLTSTGLGIGTSSPGFPLDVQSTGVGSLIAARIFRSDGTQALLRIGNSTSGSAASAPAFGSDTTSAVIYTNNTERARIDSSGNLLVGTTSTNLTSGGHAIIPTAIGETYTLTGHDTGTASGATYAAYMYNNSIIGSITQSGTTAVAYNTSSDYRLKNTIAPMTGALAKVAALKPCTYKWKADGSDGEGFIAHELAEVCPQAVTGEKDAVDAEGNPKYQGIDTSFLVATLTAAIQEQTALIASLTARLDAANL